MITVDPQEITPQHLHRVLLSAVAPRPIAFASTIDNSGKANLSPFSCFNVFGSNPSTLIFSPSRSGMTNELKDTYLNIKEIPEVVINTVTYSMVEQMNLASTEFSRGINEFYKSGFTPIQSDKVKPFRVKESPIQVECKVRQVIETGTGAGAANLVICEALRIHINEKILDKTGTIDNRKLDLVGRLGADYYVRASGRALFTLEKPKGKSAIGVDSLPEQIRLSQFLSGNDLGKLGSIPVMPTAPEISKYSTSPLFRTLSTKNSGNAIMMVEETHKKAHNLIAQNQITEALVLLLSVNQLINNDL
jgi:flavin reductase (DIM6/NTAB) family NADH-FMN oxidoreductase RutF